MGEEKVEQNIDRLSNFIFHILGCGKEDARRIVRGFYFKYLDEKEIFKDIKTNKKSNIDYVSKWAEFVRDNPAEIWSEVQNAVINLQFEEWRKLKREEKFWKD